MGNGYYSVGASGRMNGLGEDITTQAATIGQQGADILAEIERLKQQYWPGGTPGINPDGSQMTLTTDTPLPTATASEDSGINWWLVGGVGAVVLWMLYN